MLFRLQILARREGLNTSDVTLASLLPLSTNGIFTQALIKTEN